jgi:hypothetical protein
MYLEVSQDDGPYGENEISDQATWVSPETTQVVFDEWTSFKNRGYEVTFYVSDGRIAPGNRRVAYTIHATASAADSIPVSEGAQPQPSTLIRIRRSLKELPLVEVVEVRPGSSRLIRLPHAELVGWASDSEVIVIENGHVAAVDVTTRQQRRSDIPVRTAADAFVIWR